MKVTVNGVEVELKKGATLKDALADTDYVDGTVVSIHKSTESLTIESEDFEVVTTKGTFCVHLNDSEYAELWKAKVSEISGSTARWVTHDIAAFGSFPTELPVERTENLYRKYDLFFSLGGFDSSTTYVMVAREDHTWNYGAGKALIGRVTRGRHVIENLTEEDSITSIGPVTSEEITENFVVTSDLKVKLEEGNIIDTAVRVKVNMNCPESAEHLMIISQKKYVNATEASGSFVGSYDDTDVKIAKEECSVREDGAVFVRNSGVGTGRVFFYKERRQTSQNHNHIGDIVAGKSIISSAKDGDKIALVTEPKRTLAVGMTMAEGEAYLRASGIEVERVGETSDESIIVEQTPEMTVTLLNEGKAKLFGVKKEDIYRISLDRKREQDVHYFEKITGLNHKPIGSLKVYFWFEGMSMVTFTGDEEKGKSLYPADPFKKCKRGDLGLTNQACGHRGTIGIRLEDSKSYGPTGEEAFGTNIFGKFLGDLDKFTESLEDGKTVYITELEL